MTPRQEKALKLKGSHKIYYEDQTADAKKEFGSDYDDTYMKNVRIVTDLEKTDVVSTTGWDQGFYGRAKIPDWTPDWLYEILDLWDTSEFMESLFEFASKEDADEFRAICDFVNE